MYDELLQLSTELMNLATSKKGAEQEITFRRAVSTAYYALFHLLIYEAASRLVAGTGSPTVTPRRRYAVSRAFSHTQLRKLCVAFSGHPNALPTGAKSRTLSLVQTIVVPEDLGVVAWNFAELHGSREWADYDFARPMSLTDAATAQRFAVEAFARWATVSNSPEARLFLGLLPVYGVDRK